MSTKQIKINEIIFSKIEFRYEFIKDNVYSSVRNYNQKVLADSLYPGLIARCIVNNQEMSETVRNTNNYGYCLSELVAMDMGVKKLHISEITSMLGHTKTSISKLLQLVKNQGYSISLIGLGGTGSNFLHWLYEMSQWTGKTQIFQRIYCYDDDHYDVPNMLRIPFIPEKRGTVVSSLKVNNIPKKFEALCSAMYFYPERYDRNAEPIRGVNKMILYGAPDIATRELLSAAELPFFAATHRDNEYSIVINPEVDNELMAETYGKINLSVFFLNQLSMTIDFMEYLSTVGIIDSTVRNETIIRSNFDGDKFNVGFKAGTKKMFPTKVTNQTTFRLNIPEGEQV